MEHLPGRARRRIEPGTAAGAALVLLGIFALAVEYLPVPGFDLGHYGWPLIVVVGGLLLIGFGAAVAGASGLAVPGGIVLMTGLVLTAQNALDAFQTWAYAWALVAPGGVGVGLIAQGWIRRSRVQVRAGARTLWTGLLLFVVLGAFFEGVVHLSHLDLGIYGKLVLPVALIVGGVLLIGRRLAPRA